MSSEWLSRVADEDDDEIVDLDENLKRKQYESLFRNCREEENFGKKLCWGHLNYERPKLSEIPSTPDLVQRSQTFLFNCKTLDEFDAKPNFSVLNEKDGKSLPRSVKCVLKKKDLWEVLLKTNPSYSESQSENGTTESQSSSSSVISSNDIDGFQNDFPTAYRKSNNSPTSTMMNEKKVKQLLKRQKKQQKNVNQSQTAYLEEKHDVLNDIVPLHAPNIKQFTLNIAASPSKTSNKPDKFENHFKIPLEENHISQKEFPELSNDRILKLRKKLSEEHNVINATPKYDLDVIHSRHEKNMDQDILVMDNIPISVDDKDINDFFETFPNDHITILNMLKAPNGKKEIHFVTQQDANWIADCINGQNIFGDKCTESVRCFVK